MIEKPQPIILSRISAEQLQEYKEKVNKVVYLCDGTACNRNCKELGFGRCRRTGEEDHAINKGKYNGFELSRYYDYFVLEEIEAEPVDEWLPENERPKSNRFFCSKCKGTVYGKFPGSPIGQFVKTCDYPYCPYCLSPMKPYYISLESKRRGKKK